MTDDNYYWSKELPWQSLMNKGNATGTARMRVSGGWLYRAEGYGMAFVPDATAEHVRDEL